MGHDQFSKGGVMGLKTYRQLFVDVDSLSAYFRCNTGQAVG